MLDDDEARRIGQLSKDLREPEARRWIGELLGDRRERLGIDQALARQVHATRRRLRQALEYLDGLLAATQETARGSTPGKILCPTCGAPATGVRSIQSGKTDASFLVVHDHPDGKTCAPTKSVR